MRPRKNGLEAPSYVVRIDGDRASGWQFRLPAGHPSHPSSKFFSDSLYGGRDGALAAATTHRNDTLKSIDEHRHVGRPRHHSKHSGNTTGILGVTLSRNHSPGRPGHTDNPNTGHLYWTAYWSPDPDKGQIRRNFPIDKMGFLPAWEAAVALREKAIGERLSDYQRAIGRLRCMEKLLELNRQGIFPPVEEPNNERKRTPAEL